VIDPGDLKWIWLTHPDFDHVGALHQLLEENAHVKVITTFLGVGVMSLSNPLPLAGASWLAPERAPYALVEHSFPALAA
jgi:glyoxylase-like metal-dependent hydrolase (beta-lactamase superfamily II)